MRYYLRHNGGSCGMIRPVDSPFGSTLARCCLASLSSNLNAGAHPHDFVYVISGFGGVTEVLDIMVGRAGFEPATN